MTYHAVHLVTQIYSHVTTRYYYTAILIIGHVTQLDYFRFAKSIK